jgi:outer membrane protein OmpA-like peptidoglycan-associated protein
MDRPEDASQVTRTTHERSSETRWAHRNLGGPWWLALLVVPLLLAALVSVVKGGDIEADLGSRSLAALKANGLDGVTVDFSGRDATVSAVAGSGLSEADLKQAGDLVAGVDGVRVADVDTAGLAAEPDGTTDPGAEESTPAADPACEATAVQTQIDELLGEDKITFAEGSSVIDASSADEVAKAGALIAGCPDLSVTASGHTDRAGAKGERSQQRADAVKVALEAAGVTTDSIEAVGARDTEPLGDNDTKVGRDMNRYGNIVVK